jgi:hypothetical protein
LKKRERREKGMAQLGKKGKGKSTRALSVFSLLLLLLSLSLAEKISVRAIGKKRTHNTTQQERERKRSGSVKCAKWIGRRTEEKVGSVQQLYYRKSRIQIDEREGL